MARTTYREIDDGSGFRAVLGLVGAVAALGAFCAFYMEEHGHVVTGMSNDVVWGIPHVFAFFMIVGASGALNVASMSSVFGRTRYKLLTRLSGLLAVALLGGGLAVLVLDLGRPDRLMVAMTNYNFKSVFAWNINFYVGFAAIVALYLFVQMARGFDRYVGAAGLLAFVWRLALTTATGSVLGFLVARQSYDAAIMAPLFIAMSLAVGQAIFLLLLMLVSAGAGRPLGGGLLHRFMRLLGIFTTVTLYFTVVQHLANFYGAKHETVERFILLDGGIYTALFWIWFVALGSLLPIALAFSPAAARSRALIAGAALLVIIGGLAHLYVIIVGGQAYPLPLFPGMEVVSSFRDGVVASYRPSLPEFGLAIGGMAFAALIVLVGIRLFPFAPRSLADEATQASAAGEGAPAG
jgi:[DsrC]-trisulfide reductase subunit P